MKKLGDFYVKLLNITSNTSYKIINFFSLIGCWIFKYLMCFPGLLLYDFLRKITPPFHKLWITAWKFITFGRKQKEPLDEHGIHLGVALMGGGKTSLAYQKAEDYRLKYGKSMYINSPFEKRRYDEIGGYEYTYHKLFKDSDFFANSKVRARPDYRHFCGFIFDEELKNNNHRNNKSREYNERFLGRNELFYSMRHFRMNYILVFSQLDKIDNQALGLVKYYHEIQVKKGVDYQDWKRTGKFEITILGWEIDTYKFERMNGEYKKKFYKRWFKQRTCDLNYYDTLALSREYDELPIEGVSNSI